MLDIVLVELAHHRLRPLRHVNRAIIGELARRDQNAARVHANVARQAFHPFSERQQLAHFFFFLLALPELRFHRARHLQGDGFSRLHRNKFRQLVAEVVRQIQHSPYIAHRRFGRHGAEGGDLRDAVLAKLLFHILDHLFPAVLAEIHVEVGHGHPFRVKKTLEQEIVVQRIQVGDPQRISHQRTGAGAASRADRHIVLLRPVDEVRDNQEITGITHLHDSAGFKVQPLLVNRHLLRPLRGIRIERVQPLLKSRQRTLAQILIEAEIIGRRKLREPAFAQLHFQIAALGDFHAVQERFGNIGK